LVHQTRNSFLLLCSRIKEIKRKSRIDDTKGKISDGTKEVEVLHADGK